MKKFVWPLALFMVVATIVFYYFYEIVQEKFRFLDENVSKQESTTPSIPQEKPAQAAANDLPAVLPLTKLDGTEVMANTLLDKTILVVFLPDCDHCQREAAQIQKHLSAFKAYTLYFISSANLLEIKQFSEKYKLAGHDNILMAHTEQVYLNNSFGYIPTPSMYIYSKGHLIKDFKGETPIDSILPLLSNSTTSAH